MKTQNLSLLIDDIREFPDIDLTARDPITGKVMLENNDIGSLYLDHDLGFDETGYDIIKWAIKEDYVPDMVIIVSSNPVGRDNIGNALVSYGYKKLNPYTFIKVN